MATGKEALKEGTFRAEAPPSQKELYTLLGEIGTKRKSIQPRVLIDFPRIFRCPQIAHGAKRSATTYELANTAHSALKEAVAALPDQTDRLVAEAILAMGRFEGKRVDTRKRDVASIDNFGCTEDSYKHRRPRILNEICRYLLTETSGPIRDTTESPVGNRGPVSRYSADALNRAAAELHFRALAALFLVHINKSADSEFLHRSLRLEAWSECREDFFAALAEFVSVLYPLYDSSPSQKLTDKAQAELEGYLPSTVMDSLASLYNSLLVTGPRFEDLNVQELVAYADGYVFPGEIEAYFMWNRWYDDPENGTRLLEDASRTTDLCPWPTAVERIAAKAGHMERLISEHTDMPGSATLSARRRAHKALSYYFDIDENLPLIEGRSLRDWIDSFFDASRIKLAADAIVWFDSREGE